MTDPFATLPALWTHVWDRLAGGVARSDDPFRLVSLATCGEDGPEVRTVALRAADRRAMTVEVHSDVRTAKVRALGRDPRGQILLWDADAQLQVRLSVRFDVLRGEAGRWAQVPPEARTNYGTDPAPGTPVDAPEDVTRTPEPSRFAALAGAVRSMDVVSLAHEPHRRAMFDGRAGRWTAP